ncbi:MAG: hypothetical protein ACLVJH_10980 [Faecalibacterium prausnitzii]
MVSIGTIGLIKAVNTFTPAAEHQAGHLRHPLHRKRDPDVPAQKLQPHGTRSVIDEPLNIDWRRQRAAAFGHSGQRCRTASSQRIEQDAERTACSPRRWQQLSTRGTADHGAALRPCSTARSRPRRRSPTSSASPRRYISRLEKRIIKKLKKDAGKRA